MFVYCRSESVHGFVKKGMSCAAGLLKNEVIQANE